MALIAPSPPSTGEIDAENLVNLELTPWNPS
jgi:hypothetical protein